MVNAAPTEGKVLVGMAGQIKGVGIFEVLLITVGRTEDREYEFSSGYFGL